MHKKIKEKDFILIIDDTEEKYLQIGEVIEVKNYPHSDDVMNYIVRFKDEICKYDYDLEYISRVLMLV